MSAIVIVSGAIANKYLKGGEVWHRLSWVLGLKKLGFTVYFLEQISPNACLDATGAITAFERSVNLAYFQHIAQQFGLLGSAALIYDNGRQIYGLSYIELLELSDAADILINISGHLTMEPLTRRLRQKVYIDEDPGFTQFWQAAGDSALRLHDHQFCFTIGENIGTPACPIPTVGISWRRTRPFVVLGHWPTSADGNRNRCTTIAGWRGPYGPIQYGGETFGLKVHEFRKFIELPQRAPEIFEIALDIDTADTNDLNLLLRHGWQIVDPKAVAFDPTSFRRYVQTSGVEFSVAKGIYVETGSGWFSDRTVRYLASGKPALVQDTGFSYNYPVGDGLVPFRTLEEAVVGAERIMRDYDKHCLAARELAEAYFDSDQVLGQLIDEVGIAP